MAARLDRAIERSRKAAPTFPLKLIEHRKAD
jgi:hypothetical protein